MNFLRSKAARARKIPTLPAPPADGSLRVLQVDFAKYGFPELSSRTCIIIDNLLTPDDVNKLYTSAVSSGEWTAAEVNVGSGRQVLATDYRNSGRIILDSDELARWLFEKIEPHLPAHVVSIPKAPHHARIRSPAYKEAKEKSNEGVLDTNNAKSKEPVAKCTRLNERLRFLRYEKGMFFNPHYDGQYWTPDKKEVSYYTLQVYLSGEQNEDPPEGGATRIFGNEAFRRGWETAEQGATYIDVEPLPGRVLVFEQDGIPHSGEEVTKGVKYSVRTDFMYDVVPSE